MQISANKIKIIAVAVVLLIAAGVYFSRPNDKGNSILSTVVKDIVATTSNLGEEQDKDNKTTSKPAVNVGFVSAADLHQTCEAELQSSDKFDCYELAFKNYMEANIDNDGGKKTLVLLDDLIKLGGYSLSNCHPLAHKVGNIALHVYGTVLAAVPQYLPVCASGFYHGLLEEYLATAPDYYTGIKEVCGSPDGEFFNWFQCTHGLGHGVMQHNDNEVPQSLKDCDQINPARGGQEICYAGVFMENITTEEKTGHQSKYIKLDNPIYPCDFVEAKYKSACYFLSSSQILKINHWNFQDAFNVCDTKAETAYRWLCYESMGRDVSGSTLRNKTEVIRLCNLGSPDMRHECYFGAVRDFINDKGTFDTAIDLCNSIPADYRGKCYSGVILDLGLYKTGQDYLNVCNTMQEAYKEDCVRQVRT